MPATQPTPAELDLPFIAHCELVHQLRRALPAPENASPEALLRRDRAAIQQISALVPASTNEVGLGVDYVLATAWARHCMDNAAHLPANAGDQRRQLAMAASMMRQAQGYHALLLRVQAARRKREAANVAQADWTEHCALGTLRQALDAVSVPLGEPAAPDAGAPAVVEAAVAAPHPPVSEPPRDASRRPVAEPPAGPGRRSARRAPGEPDEPVRDLCAEAERYAIIYPRRAQAIRRQRGLPPDCDFGPPEPELLAAIVTGTTPALRALDRMQQVE